jgi:hypothetical protein
MSNIESILTETRLFEASDEVKNTFAISEQKLNELREKVVLQIRWFLKVLRKGIVSLFICQ